MKDMKTGKKMLKKTKIKIELNDIKKYLNYMKKKIFMF